jgi:hypothetical protein
MMYIYLTKDIGPIPGNRVERFSEDKAARLIMDGDAERFDPKKHGNKPGAPRLAEAPKNRMVSRSVTK